MMKLGEALVKEALITTQQLEQALKRQIQFGGRIGTNLLELRYIDETELTKFLSKYFKVAPAPLDLLNNIPEDIISSISIDVIDKYKILPFKKERSRMHTAMLNPKDIRELDELRFITGFDIIPYVISEMRLLYSLEKYYGIKRNVRFISLSDRFNPETKIEENSINKIKIAFTEVKDIEGIAGLLLNEAYKIAKRTALFTVKSGTIMGWKGRGLNVETFSMQEKGQSVFSDVLRNKSSYRGPILNVKENEALIRLLSGTPQDVLILPIILRDRVISLLYADNGVSSVLNANVGFLSLLASMAAISFEILILRKRILDLNFPL